MITPVINAAVANLFSFFVSHSLMPFEKLIQFINCKRYVAKSEMNIKFEFP